MDAIVMSESVQPFDESRQNPLRRCTDEGTQPSQDIVTPPSVKRLNFIQDVEKIVCGKVTDAKLKRPVKEPNYKGVEERHLRGTRQGRPYSTARQIIWLILYTHPETKSETDTVSLGRLYRRDHTTVNHGIHRAAAIIQRFPKDILTQIAMEACASLEEKHGDYDIQQAARWAIRNK